MFKLYFKLENEPVLCHKKTWNLNSYQIFDWFQMVKKASWLVVRDSPVQILFIFNKSQKVPWLKVALNPSCMCPVHDMYKSMADAQGSYVRMPRWITRLSEPSSRCAWPLSLSQPQQSAQKVFQSNLTLKCILGLGAFLVERSFFPENERNDQERSHRSEKNGRLERVLKNFGTVSKRTEQNGSGIDWKERLKSLTRSYFKNAF